VLAELATALLVAGALGCGVAAVRGASGHALGGTSAAALLAAAFSHAGASAWPLRVSIVLAILALAVAVRRRFETLPWLSLLDAVMGATASGALAVALGLSVEVSLAVAGVVGALALSRWQPSVTILLLGGATLLLGGGEDVAAVAAAPCVLAAWRSEARVGPGPEFRWTVLAAIVCFATTALTLLAIGQFTRLSDVAGALALATVLVGMARAGFTVTERLRESNERALTDDLTGLANRRHLVERLQAAIDRGGDSALLLIDLDGFKELNDTLGHHAGDEVLRQIGPRLAEAVRGHDTLARLGGDEFALILAPGDEAAASAAGLRLRHALERSFAVQDIAVHIDASVGIALFPEHAEDPIGLLQRADVAMYEAKRMRTGHEVYLPERDRHSRQRLALVGELHDAIAAGQLMLHYQPKATLPEGEVQGVEALVRWHHPERGLLTPGHFLPLAEQSGLTRALTVFVLDRALTEMADLPALTVAVNLGPADLLDFELPAEVARALERRDFAPERLTLEVSEDLIAADPERTLSVLRGLRSLGVRLALDDFGAGRSSLQHLRGLELDELKVDRTFVLEMSDSARDLAIVAGTIDLGHRLGLRVVGEGAATPEVWDALTTHGCDEAQGELLSSPLPMADLRVWLGERARARASAGPGDRRRG
jgi:diguanylate cyclase (GGDEF)-like protein